MGNKGGGKSLLHAAVFILCAASLMLVSFASADEINYSSEVNNSSFTIELTEADIEELADTYEEKLNPQTEAYLKNIDDVKEEQTFIIQFLDEPTSELDEFPEKTEVTNKLSRITADVGSASGLLAESNVAYFEIDQETTLFGETTPWGVTRVGAPTVWNNTTGSGIKIAVLDTGIAAHPDLVIAGGEAIVGDNYTDENGHGTAVAGVIAAVMDSNGIVGVAPDAEIYSVKILNGSSGSLSDAITGVQWAIDNDIDIVVMSFGIESYSTIFRDVIAEAYDDGILLIAASGNDGIEGTLYPAAYDDVIAVGAVDENNDLATFSSYGSQLDLVAPGVNINTTGLESMYTIVNGTSFAAPHVAGITSLLKSYNNSLSSADILAKLQNDAIDLGVIGRDDYFGYGLAQINLTSNNYSVNNESYDYSIYNFSDYGQGNQSTTFWLNGSGSIDDIEFAEGFYLIWRNDTGHQIVRVNENSIITTLSAEINIASDSYTIYGGTDGIVWEDGSLSFSCADCAVPDVACYYSSGYEECWARSSSLLTACRSAEAYLDNFCTSNPSLCHTTGIGSSHIYPEDQLETEMHSTLVQYAYETCSSGLFTYDDQTHVYVIDRLNTTCSGSSAYNVLGRYDGVGTPNWKILTTVTCPSGSTCVPAQAGYVTSNEAYNYTSSDAGIHNPCSGTSGTDLAITSITPIQTVGSAHLIVNKKGYVVVEVANLGNSTNVGNVSAWANGVPLPISTNAEISSRYTDNPRTIFIGVPELFIFDYTPASSGTNVVINASVGVTS